MDDTAFKLIKRYSEGKKQLEKENDGLKSELQKMRTPEERCHAFQGQGHNINHREVNAVTKQSIALKDRQEQDGASNIPTIKIKRHKIVEDEYKIDLRLIISDYPDEQDEIWGKKYDVGSSEMIWLTQSRNYEFYQMGHWFEIIFITSNGNWPSVPM